MDELDSASWKALSRVSTVGLIRRVVDDSDVLALTVLLETRKLFRLKDEPPLLLTEFLMKLRGRLAGPEYSENVVKDRSELADCAYDLTVAKYSNFPVPRNKILKSKDYPVKGMKTDCRNYYRAFLGKMLKRKERGEYSSQSEEESDAGRTLQSLVYHNYLKSILECARQLRSVIRYPWEVDGGSIVLEYPSYITAREFRQWLAENITDVDPQRPGERQRIQAIVDAKFRRGHHVSLDQTGVVTRLGTEEKPSSVELDQEIVFVNTLAKAVAQKKAADIADLRPSIRKLESKGIRQLINQIFKDISRDEYAAVQVAAQFGISKSALSRFAGTEWFEKGGDSEVLKVPDLWQNTAKVLAKDETFVQTVIHSGRCGKLQKILELCEPQKDQDNGK